VAEKFFSLRDFENIILNHNGKKLFYGAVIVTVVIAVTLLAGKFVPSIQEGGIIVKFSAGAFATAAECGDKSYMTNTADYIIQGIVEKVRGKCICKENTTQILTYTDMKIEKYIKGTPLKTNKLQIITPGGCCVIEEEDCYGNIGEEICAGVEDAPILHEGKRVILYLRKVPKEFREFGEEFSIVCGNLGVEEISEECQDECSPEGVRECVAMISPEGETTGYRICGNYDGDSCLEWSKVFSCPEGTTCVNGKCESISQKEAGQAQAGSTAPPAPPRTSQGAQSPAPRTANATPPALPPGGMPPAPSSGSSSQSTGSPTSPPAPP